MNRERAKQLLPIIQAFAEGKQIQFRVQYRTDWSDLDEPCWQDGNEYRIKPERRKVWVLFCPYGSAVSDPNEKIVRGWQQQYGGKVVCVEEPE